MDLHSYPAICVKSMNQVYRKHSSFQNVFRLIIKLLCMTKPVPSKLLILNSVANEEIFW